MRRRWKWVAAAALLIVLAAGSGLYWRARNQLKLTNEDTIVLADFTNNTPEGYQC